MKTKMKIFNIVVGAILCALPVATHATEDCPFFSPAIALCSVHSYNIGDATNPTDVGRATEMNDIIALKTTVMVQQLKQQYDDLNAVIKRFKTQLNKAVLTSKIEVLTGNTSSSTNSSSGGYSSNNGISISGASDCSNNASSANTSSCLQQNIPLIITTANSGKTSDARNQLIRDMNIAITWDLCQAKPTNAKDGIYQCCASVTNGNVDQVIKNMNASALVACANQFRAAIIQKTEYMQNQNHARNPWGTY